MSQTASRSRSPSPEYASLSMVPTMEYIHTAGKNPFSTYSGHEQLHTFCAWTYKQEDGSLKTTKHEEQTLPAAQLEKNPERDELMPWLDNIPKNDIGEAPVAGYRLLLVPVHWDRMDDNPTEQDLAMDKIGQQNVEDAFDTWNFPKLFMHWVFEVRYQFTKIPTPDSSRNAQSTYAIINDHWGMVWRYNIDTGIQDAILCFNPQSKRRTLHRVRNLLEKMAYFAPQKEFFSLLASTIAITIATAAISSEQGTATDIGLDITKHFEEQAASEKASADATPKSDDASEKKAEVKEFRDYAKFSAAASATVRASIVIKCNLKAMTECNAYLETHLKKLREAGTTKDDMGRHMAEYVSMLQATVVSQVELNGLVLGQATSWQAALYSIMSQRDSKLSIDIAMTSRELAAESRRDQAISIEIARASKAIALVSKRDSTSMKQIAFVTMLFLPGTFVASHMDMPLFDWFNTNKQGVVNKYYGLYWAFTLPITVAVILYCYLRVRKADKIHQEEDEREMGRMERAMSGLEDLGRKEKRS